MSRTTIINEIQVVSEHNVMPEVSFIPGLPSRGEEYAQRHTEQQEPLSPHGHIAHLHVMAESIATCARPSGSDYLWVSNMMIDRKHAPFPFGGGT